MKPKICKCCGAPLQGYKCDYCGTEYEKEEFVIPSYQVVTEYRNVDTIACKTELDLYARNLWGTDEEEIKQILKNRMAYELSDKLVEYMDIETWVDPMTLKQIFGGKIRVVRPNSERW